jgi:hypothetical protein
MYLRNILQGFARGILALRSLDTIFSYLTPTLSPPPPVPLLDAPVPFVECPEQLNLLYPSRDVIAMERQSGSRLAFSNLSLVSYCSNTKPVP